MAWMAGNIGAILAVGLLGCTRTCQMVLASLTVRLNRSNRTVCTNSGQTGTSAVCEHQVGGNIPHGRGRRKRDLRNELRRTEVLAAIMAADMRCGLRTSASSRESLTREDLAQFGPE
jgi:hypothetical protein